VCGLKNPIGLQVEFFSDGRLVWAEFTPQEYHQSWPSLMHGGLISTLLDETISRVAFIYDKWVQTGKLEVKFRKPTPIGQKLRVTGMLVRDSGRAMEMRGEIRLLETGDLLAEAIGLFVRIPDKARNELVAQLGGGFAEWEQWLAKVKETNG
jgi:acyl-coenzyme A thioesterase PaaI-like protein